MNGEPELTWAVSERPPALYDNEVHVWSANLQVPADVVANLLSVLSGDERARAARFRFDVDRNEYTVRRGILRRILSRYAGTDPQEIAFTYSRFGKPALYRPQDSGIEFNLSRSKGLALYAFARNRIVGVDVEYIDNCIDGESIVERFFSPAEVATWRGLATALRADGFFNAWTRKEAFIKAIGEGLSMPLNCFDVTLVPGAPAMLTRPLPCKWSVRDLRPKPCYAGALVVERFDWQIRCFRWTETEI